MFGDSIYIKHTPVLQQEGMKAWVLSFVYSDSN
jgi:hypothetical protein